MEQRIAEPVATPAVWRTQSATILFVVMVVGLIVAPFFTYPLFLMQAMCFALFACAFNLLIGYVGLLSFGHALYFGWASYLSAYAAKAWGFTRPVPCWGCWPARWRSAARAFISR